MKIISKYKDYYDYLNGIWGEDPKIILDRRINHQPSFYPQDDKFGSIFFCGDQIDFVYKNGNFIYLEELEKHYGKAYFPFSYWRKFNGVNDGRKRVHVGDRLEAFTEIVPDEKQHNLKLNCPIILKFGINEYHYPKLTDLDFQQVMKPEEVYLRLSEWLSPKETTTNNQTDIEKLITHGFDKIKSFRNRK